MSKCHIVGNHMSRLIFFFKGQHVKHYFEVNVNAISVFAIFYGQRYILCELYIIYCVIHDFPDIKSEYDQQIPQSQIKDQNVFK